MTYGSRRLQLQIVRKETPAGTMMKKDIVKPIETEYNGDRFRSKLEAQWAVVFDALGIKYEYEPEGFELKDGTKYLPDFYFPDQDTYGEVKPDRPGALDELFDKPLKFVESGAIKKLVILPNIPAATKKDPVWWIPLVMYNPLATVNVKQPFSTLRISKAVLDKGEICTNHTIGRHEEIELTGEYLPFICEYMSYYEPFNRNSNFGKDTIETLSEMFLHAIPSRYTWYFVCYDKNGERSSTYDGNDKISRSGVCGYEEVEDVKLVMSALRKGRQARFDHGQTPKV